MTKDVYITLVNLQTHENGLQDRTELETRGCFYQKGQKIYLFYQETDPETGQVTENSLRFEGDQARLSRTGAVQGTMLFHPGLVTATMYPTPFGSLPFKIHTHRVSLSLEETIGRFTLCYSLYQEELLLFHCDLEIQIKSI